MISPLVRNTMIALLSTTVISPVVLAQDVADADITSVYDRFRPDFTAPGIRTGSFLFYPAIEATAEYNTNIYAQETGENDDLIGIVKPSFFLTSDWGTHSFSLFGDAKIGRYAEYTDENYEDFTLGTSGTVDISNGDSLSMSISYDDTHEDRGAPDSGGQGFGYTPYTVFTGTVGYQRDKGMFTLAVDGTYAKNNYDNVAFIGDPTRILINDDRDREQYTGSARVGYKLNETYEAFVKFTTTAINYEDSRIDGGPLRDSDGWNVVGGTAFNIGGKSLGEVYLGYVKRDYDSRSLEDINKFKFGASFLWNATGLTSVQAAVDRSILETTISTLNTATVFVPASGILATSYSLTLEHELQRYLLLNAFASYTDMDYIFRSQDDASRKDKMTSLGMGAKYLMNRTLALNLNYKFDKRDSDVTGSDYDRHSVILSLSAQW